MSTDGVSRRAFLHRGLAVTGGLTALAAATSPLWELTSGDLPTMEEFLQRHYKEMSAEEMAAALERIRAARCQGEAQAARRRSVVDIRAAHRFVTDRIDDPDLVGCHVGRIDIEVEIRMIFRPDERLRHFGEDTYLGFAVDPVSPQRAFVTRLPAHQHAAAGRLGCEAGDAYRVIARRLGREAYRQSVG